MDQMATLKRCERIENLFKRLKPGERVTLDSKVELLSFEDSQNNRNYKGIIHVVSTGNQQYIVIPTDSEPVIADEHFRSDWLAGSSSINGVISGYVRATVERDGIEFTLKIQPGDVLFGER